MITVGDLARAYSIGGVFDYERRGDGMLWASGTGGMLSAMDHLPGCRWAWVMEGVTSISVELRSWATAALRLVDRLAVFAFYGVDRPEIALSLLDALPPSVSLVVYSNADFGRHRQVETFDEMVDAWTS